ncbi:hypothetical protein KLEP181_gp01 [Paracoccus phage vB_PmaP_KLEP18-1]|nr:hypothetical protein KLEP181_gp01 [Paracoccus phage vB_PmaP_KLEP18-1]
MLNAKIALAAIDLIATIAVVVAVPLILVGLVV